jgi:hypothetical protein
MTDDTIVLANTAQALGATFASLLPLVLGIGLVVAGIKRRKQTAANPNRASGTTFIVIGALLVALALLGTLGNSTDKDSTEAAPAAAQVPAAAPAPAAVSPTIPMPDLIGRSYTAGRTQIAALGIFAQVDLRDNSPFTGCTDTPTSSSPIVRTDPVAGTPLRRDGETVTLFIDRSAGTPC